MIDTTSLETLKGEIGEEDFREVVDLFILEMSEAVEGLEAASSAGTLGDALHFLKGAALNLGFSDFAALCVKGETAAKSGSPDAIDIAPIKQSYQDSSNDLAQYLSATSG